MRLEHIAVTDFRNIARAELEPGPELTVICGKNGQGKTNLLESVWLLTGGKSFRASKDEEMVRRGGAFSVIEARIDAQERKQEIRLAIGRRDTPRPGRTARLNGSDRGRAANLAGTFTAVVFHPGHLSLIKGSPAGRRKFLDAALCQLYPWYLDSLRRYTRLVAQKNALLKHYNETPDAGGMLEVFNREMSVCGQKLIERRLAYLDGLRQDAAQNYCEISSGSEALTLKYLPSCPEQELGEALQRMRAVELRAGFCLAGPHRDDVEVFLDGQPARQDASQGQQRSAVLSLKLAEAAQAERVTGEHPVMLLDDVLSELDEERQRYLLTRMEQKQTFVTSCDSTAFARTDGRLFMVERGQIREG